MSLKKVFFFFFFILRIKFTQTTIISLEPGALITEYQHFILSCIKMSLLWGWNTTERGG